ncbi:hypothetical protein Q5O24_09395 [Eubacteriaceae bacterium ES3]|nr:hypothetical protein Q5O24_09395 [Eubacteriaceae bacterium ES3]
MTNYETNEVMAQEIAEMLRKFDIFNETQIFYNQKMMTYDNEKQEFITKENIEVSEYADHGNPDMITIQYQGENSLYMIVNGFAESLEEVKRCNRIVLELIKLGEKYNRWYELGSKINLYYVSDEDDVYTTSRFDFTKTSELLN